MPIPPFLAAFVMKMDCPSSVKMFLIFLNVADDFDLALMTAASVPAITAILKLLNNWKGQEHMSQYAIRYCSN